MRPRKHILLIDADERRRSVYRCVLELQVHCRVHEAAAVPTFVSGDIDLVLAVWPVGQASLVALPCRYQTPVILCEVAADYESPRAIADATFPVGYPLALLLDRIRLMLQRKRGPRRGFEVKKKIA